MILGLCFADFDCLGFWRGSSVHGLRFACLICGLFLGVAICLILWSYADLPDGFRLWVVCMLFAG